MEDGLPSDTSSWLYDAIITFRVTLQYPAWRDPVSLGTQVLLLQAKEELGGLLEPDADTQALEDLITPAARQRASPSSLVPKFNKTGYAWQSQTKAKPHVHGDW